MNSKEIAQEVKICILFRDENDGALKRIAEILGLSRRTVYAYLDGEIKMSIDFLHAACIATDGDPDVKKFLEPDGWELSRKIFAASPTDDIERELGDVHVAAGTLHADVRKVISGGEILPADRSGIIRSIEMLKHQIAEVESMVPLS